MVQWSVRGICILAVSNPLAYFARRGIVRRAVCVPFAGIRFKMAEDTWEKLSKRSRKRFNLFARRKDRHRDLSPMM